MSLNKGAIKLIKKYQNNKPPGTPARCIHYPSCSNYAVECYEKFNFVKASFLSAKRILFCTPLNHKTYDPVPLTKEEKKIDKELWEEANKIKDILISHYQKYPLMEANDFIKLIYQNSFGPNHLNLDMDKVRTHLIKELEEVDNTLQYIEDIGNGYERIYLYKGMDIEPLINRFIKSNKEKEENDTRIFYRKISLFNKLVNKKIIKLNKKKTSAYIKDYLYNHYGAVSHSDIYKENYHPHYLVVKKESN